MKKTLVVLCALLLSLAFLFVPVSAIGGNLFDVWQYLSGSSVDEPGSTTYRFDLPQLALKNSSWYAESSEDYFDGYGTVLDIPLVEDDVTNIGFDAFGYGNFISNSLFPGGSSLYLELYYTLSFSHDTDISYSVTVCYVDSSGGVIDYDTINGLNSDGYFLSGDFILRNVPNSVGFFFSFGMEVGCLYSGVGEMSVETLVLESMITDSTLSSSQNQQILDKIDQIINGYTPDPSDPSGGLGNAFDDAEQEVLDKVENGRDEIDTIIDEFSVYLEEFLPGIVVVSNWLNILLELKFIRVLLFFSLAFGMCGLFLGVANSFRGKS